MQEQFAAIPSLNCYQLLKFKKSCPLLYLVVRGLLENRSIFICGQCIFSRSEQTKSDFISRRFERVFLVARLFCMLAENSTGQSL